MTEPDCNEASSVAVSRTWGERSPLPKLLLMTALLSCVVAAPVASAETGPGKGYQAVSDGAFSVVAEVRAKPGKEDALRAATLPLITRVRSDPKTLVYFLQEDRSSPGHFVFYEVFATEADFAAHNAQPYVKAWFAMLPDLALGDVQTMQLRILDRATP